ncbi:MAG: sulfate/molybdate ABC transporter ATP-binding protein [Thermoguttaceae bacterium]|jgi:sulfate transport system ATP-binding protein
MSIEVRHIVKSFGTFKALDDVSIRINTGELVALLGPSGSGKTTLLRIIAGLEVPDPVSGPIFFSGHDVGTQKVRDRGVGFVFQHYALFRHMTVYDNIAFGLTVKPRKVRLPKEKIREKVMKLLNMIQLDNLADRFPSQLSGGQRQRVALARALAVEPNVLLLDEPFGALDAKVRMELRGWLRRLHNEIHLTSVFVTHDQDEALELADRVAVMNNGKIEQFDTPDNLFHQPATAFVMNFLGQVNQFHGRMAGEGQVKIGNHHGRAAKMVMNRSNRTDDGAAAIFVRPHDLEIVRKPIEGRLCLPATIDRIHSAGAHVRVDLHSENNENLVAEISHYDSERLRLAKGDTCYVTPTSIRVFDLVDSEVYP